MKRARIQGRFAMVPLVLLQDRSITKNMLRVYITLAAYRDAETGEAFPSRDRIASESGVSRSGVSEAIGALKKLGWIEVERRPNLNNLYHVLVPVEGEVFDRPSKLNGKTNNLKQFGEPGIPDNGEPETPANGEPGIPATNIPLEHTTNHTNFELALVSEGILSKPQPSNLKDPLAAHIENTMTEVQPFENYGRERGHIAKIATICRRRDSQHPEQVADAMMDMFKRLIDEGGKFWASQPYTPSRLSSQWEAIEAEGRRMNERQRNDMEQRMKLERAIAWRNGA